MLDAGSCCCFLLAAAAAAVVTAAAGWLAGYGDTILLPRGFLMQQLLMSGSALLFWLMFPGRWIPREYVEHHGPDRTQPRATSSVHEPGWCVSLSASRTIDR
ncbi:hypothetical protein PG991_008334 [Apiospora marii]|uniref:Uncharacterized protein n=1 Tax=Apiospora marii TaxID=335849 RepID=A0ABR1RQQ5_9PEZI